MTFWEERLKIYDAIIAKCPRFERKGKKVPSTTANGGMFSMLNADGQIGFRFSKEVQQKYIQEWNSDLFRAYNSTMKGYVLVPDHMLDDLDLLARYLNESYDYVNSLEK